MDELKIPDDMNHPELIEKLENNSGICAEKIVSIRDFLIALGCPEESEETE